VIARLKLVPYRAEWLAAVLFAGAMAFSFALSANAAQQSAPATAAPQTNPGAPANPAELITAPGLSNSAHVSGNIYRGSTPKTEGFPELKKLGIDVVIFFDDPQRIIDKEKEQVEANGMTFISIPWNAAHDPPRLCVVSFFAALRDNEGKKVFVNDLRGAERTGLMIGLYRIVHDHWTAEQAVAEMNDFHYLRHLMPHLARYVEAFPALLASDAGILTGQPAPPAPPKN
jgi:hypothetical protein